MRARKQTRAVMLAIAMAVGVATLAPSANSVAGEVPAGGRPAGSGAADVFRGPGGVFRGSPHAVALVTGDVVDVTVDASKVSVVGVRPGPGRSRISFFSTQVGGHARVIPSDTVSLLRAGRLDPRLFDLTTLVGFGYDERRKDLPLIVAAAPGAVGRMNGFAGGKGVLTVPGGGSLRAAKTALPAFWTQLAAGLAARSAVTGVSKVWLDGLRQLSLDESVPMIGAPTAWAAGFTGAGVTVAVVDSGIDSAHPDLTGRVIAAQDFSGSGTTLDQVGHGTHVAATIASNDSQYRGVAPGANLISAKVCASRFCEESAILAGMQWAVEQGAKVVNLSLSGPDLAGLDPLEAAVEDLTARTGALFVAAAGNAGAEETIGSPGSADSALTVGAVTKTDELAGFSSRGPRRGDNAIKPDITAPGVDIVAARSQDGAIGEPGETHVSLSGTSMATPHVAGGAAILLQQHPTWTPAQLKSALMASARSSATIDVFAQGAGRIDLVRAITQTVLANPPSLSYGRQLWPHNDDVPITRTVTYANLGAAAVTLNLSLTGGAPAGLFSLSAPTLTVPAGGTGSVTLTADTRVDIPDAWYTGSLVAQAGPIRLGTPFAVDKEVESHDVTLHHLDRNGQATGDFFTALVDTTTGRVHEPFADGETIRVPRGRYAVLSGIFGPEPAITMLLEPEITVDREVQITLDARSADPVSIMLPLPDAVAQLVVAVGDVSTPVGNLTGVVYGGPEVALHVGSRDPSRTSPNLHSMIVGLYTKDNVDPIEAEYVAQVMWRQTGRMFQGFTKRLKADDLAVIHAEHAADFPATGLLQLNPTWPEGWSAPVNPGSAVNVPGSRIEYYNTDDGVRWARRLIVTEEFGDQLGNVLTSFATRFEGGRHYHEKRNLAVFGPGFSPITSPEGWVIRRGDTFELAPNVANDALNWFGLPLPTDALRITLDRNGTRIFDGDAFAQVDVAPGSARYRLGVELTRQGPNTISTTVRCEWTFRSTTVRGDKAVPLPLSAVRFRPKLDEHNTAPAGTLWPVPVEVQRQPGSAAGPVRTLEIEVSYDDGATWRGVPVFRHDQTALALLTHPAGPGYVSLRASSTDSAGNTVRQTIIRAYRIA